MAHCIGSPQIYRKGVNPLPRAAQQRFREGGDYFATRNDATALKDHASTTNGDVVTNGSGCTTRLSKTPATQNSCVHEIGAHVQYRTSGPD